MKNRSVLWIVVAIVVLMLLGCGGCATVGLLTATMSDGMSMSGGAAVAVVEVKGIIVSGRGPEGLRSTMAYAQNVIEDLERAERDPAVKAIVLEVNSPGGGVVASGDIYRALQELTKPVVTVMIDTGASGGYYVACGTERILVRPATITGSIGVIATFMNLQGLYDKLGIEQEIIKTGKYKDMGSSARALTEEEREILQTIMDNSLDQFVRAVVQGRGLPEERVRELATGRIFSGRQAVELGLADEFGDTERAVEIAAELAGIGGEPRVIRYAPQTPTLLQLLGQMARGAGSAEVALLERALGESGGPRLLYLYTAP